MKEASPNPSLDPKMDDAAARFADSARAVIIAERIRAHVHESKLEGAHTITASFGIAEMQDPDTYETIFERADQALYKAKQEGRKRTAWLAALCPESEVR